MTKLFFMKRLLVFLLIINTGLVVEAQTAEDSLKSVINNLFVAMRNGDAVLLKTVFADSAILQTLVNEKAGKTVIRNEEVAGFIDFVSKQSKNAADERIVFDVIKINGDLAIVWTPYTFFYNGKFSHCGVNSFQLIRLNREWKIQYLIDTRRQNGCE